MRPDISKKLRQLGRIMFVFMLLLLACQIITLSFGWLFSALLVNFIIRGSFLLNVVLILLIFSITAIKRLKNKIFNALFVVIAGLLSFLALIAFFSLLLLGYSGVGPRNQMLIDKRNEWSYYIATDRTMAFEHLNPYFYKEKSIGIPGIKKREMVPVDEIKAVNLYSDSLYARFNEHYFQKY